MSPPAPPKLDERAPERRLGGDVLDAEAPRPGMLLSFQEEICRRSLAAHARAGRVDPVLQRVVECEVGAVIPDAVAAEQLM